MIKLKQLLCQILSEQEDYRGQHQATDKSHGAPLYDLTKIYPDDIYSPNAARYYGDDATEYSDAESVAVIQSARNKPTQQIRIYRAVPSIITSQDKIKDLENQKAYILKHGKIPNGVQTRLNGSDYYGSISTELDRLKISTSPTEVKIGINPGDWVTINKRYAISHGEANLLGKYKILSKTVPAKHLFTTGDSLHEFGYDPS